jgi:hypothetical protein
MNSHIKTTLLLVLILLLPDLLFSQNSRIRTGEHVRIKTTHSATPVTGLVMDVLQSDLYVTSTYGEFLISQSEIRTLWVRRANQRNTSSGFWIGGLSGGLVFGTIDAITWEELCTNEWSICLAPSSRGSAFFQGAVFGFIVGGLLGAGIGYFIKTERWVKVRSHDLVFNSHLTAICTKALPAVTFRLTLTGE